MRLFILAWALFNTSYFNNKSDKVTRTSKTVPSDDGVTIEENYKGDFVPLLLFPDITQIEQPKSSNTPFAPINTSPMGQSPFLEDDVAPSEQPPSSNSSEEEECKPPPTPRENDINYCGNRVAERKCCQYIWEMNHKDEILDYHICKGDTFQITGGKDAPSDEFPHMVALGWKLKSSETSKEKYKFMCGATLISENFVITAAHCTYVSLRSSFPDLLHSPKPSIVRMGAVNIGEVAAERNSIDKQSKDIKISQIVKHPKYNSPKPYYDLALLKLFKKVVFTKAIHPACISTSMVPEKTEVVATGWGVDIFGSVQIHNKLQMATLKIIGRDHCISLNKPRFNRNLKTVREDQICAGSMTGGIDTCQGDSGGPLQVKIKTKSGSMHRIVAVVSMGYKCGLKNVPGIYANVALPEIIDWIEETVWPEELGRRGIDRKLNKSD